MAKIEKEFGLTEREIGQITMTIDIAMENPGEAPFSNEDIKNLHKVWISENDLSIENREMICDLLNWRLKDDLCEAYEIDPDNEIIGMIVSCGIAMEKLA